MMTSNVHGTPKLFPSPQAAENHADKMRAEFHPKIRSIATRAVDGGAFTLKVNMPGSKVWSTVVGY